MVSQKLVEEVMVKLNRPCNARDIAEYMISNKLSTIPSDIKQDISNVLNILRKWEVTDKLPDLHGIDSNKWYLRKDGSGHDSKNCKYCKSIRSIHSKYVGDAANRSLGRKIKRDNIDIDKDTDDLQYNTWTPRYGNQRHRGSG